MKQPEATVLLTIDQAEELFGYSPPEAATRFLRLMRAALEAADRRLIAVAALRSDFLGEFQDPLGFFPDGAFQPTQGLVFIHAQVAIAAITLVQPAEREGEQGQRIPGAGIVHDGLDQAVVDLYPREARGALDDHRKVPQRHGVHGDVPITEMVWVLAVLQHRMAMEADPTSEELEALHAAFVPTMVRINAEGGYARRRALFDDLPRRALPLLRRFVDARLLVTDRDPQNRETIEVAHEALLRTWPLLGGWLAEDQD